jgi:hypothetical protein
MERNPYAPPTTPVADIASDPVASDPVVPNREVLLACKLYWVSFGLSFIGSVSGLLRISNVTLLMASVIGLIIGGAIGFVITRWIVSKLKAGKNWMRLFLTIGAVLGYFSIPIFWKFYSSTVFPIYALNPIKAGLTVLDIIPNTWALVLLNVPRSRAWFLAVKTREQSAA